MHPVPRKGLAGQRLALRDLVLVVRKHQILAARVQIEGLAQILHRHRRALDVPARTPRPNLGLPALLALFRSLPQRKVAGVVLLVFVGIRAPAAVGDQPRKVLLAQLAVLGKLAMRKYHEPSSVW